MNMNAIKSLFSAVCLSVICTSCSDDKSVEVVSKPIPVKTVEILSSNISLSKEYVGVAESQSVSSLSFQVTGQVAKVYVTEGQQVKKGQLLAVLNTDNLQSAYNASLASLKQAEDAYKRLESLYNQQSLPEIKFVEVQTKLEQARSMERISAKNLKESKLLAPFDGVIEERDIEPGENVLPNQPVFTLLNTQGVKVKVSVPENEISSVQVGDQAIVEIGALQNAEFQSTVVERSMLAHPVSHNYEIKLRVESDSASKIIPGMVCGVSLQQDLKPAIVLPNNAVLVSNSGERFVWVVSNSSVASRKTVKIGDLTDNGLVITEGLSDGDRVIVNGGYRVSEGMKVLEQNEVRL